MGPMKEACLYVLLPLIICVQCSLAPKDRPQDFTVTYDWRDASVPPPYHHEFSILIGPGANGKIDFWPDYPMHQGTPTWTESFMVELTQLDRLYHLLSNEDLFNRSEIDYTDGSVGGSSERIEIVAGGKTFVLKSNNKSEMKIKKVTMAIQSIVPGAAWSKLNSQHQKYVNEHQPAGH